MADDPFAFRPLPQRFAAYLAVRKSGEQGGHGPMEWFEGVPETDEVVGVHMIGPDAPEILQAAAVAVKARLKKADFDATVALHPTMSEELVLMK